MRRYGYSFLKDSLFPARLFTYAGAVNALVERSFILKLHYAQIFRELETIAKVQSVKNSNEIEGVISSDERIRSIVNHSTAPLNHDEMEIAGYRDALNLIHTSYQKLDICTDDIKVLHKTVYNYSEDGGGEYKSHDNTIIEIDMAGQRRVRFRPVSAKDTQFAMEQLELAWMSAKDDTGINKLLLIPCVILDFLCIHPFSDGNGRMSRLLSLLLLYKNNFTAAKYVSFEQKINERKNQYYDALRKSSVGWHENKNDYIPFIEEFVMELYLCYKELDNRFKIVNGKKQSKKTRITNAVMSSIAPISKKEICQMLPDVSASTVESVLSELLKNGKIEKIGNYKDAKYVAVRFRASVS